ncbi:hypothetical protein BDV24DRAFT_158585 [Aspergillus arachidicola]|uniref:Uncharacterized protein n=1 Tax=Aspergillus arachidicola TaxID=656916 RepID=A0A5N6YMB8_9EURO|nr:hypothetical protein BDV24DRAFT_158585 [Aspergillus arachidicola]
MFLRQEAQSRVEEERQCAVENDTFGSDYAAVFATFGKYLVGQDVDDADPDEEGWVWDLICWIRAVCAGCPVIAGYALARSEDKPLNVPFSPCVQVVSIANLDYTNGAQHW